MGRNYSRKENPATSDLSLIWSSSASDWALTSLARLKELLATDIDYVGKPKTIRSAPTTGFLQILEGSDNIHLLLLPLVGLAAGTIRLPPTSEAANKQTVLVNTTNDITSLTVESDGATVLGAPTGLSALGYFTMKYDEQSLTWYRVG